jgi:alkylation response protein AidB-like acyl-CoA dehydrogenase
MDTRDTAEQTELRRTARQLARELGPATVADLDDATRSTRLAGAVRDAGWLELRDDKGDGTPLGGGVEAAIVADALGSAVADVAFTGPVLAGDLARRAGATRPDATVVGFSETLIDPTSAAFAVDAADADGALVLVSDGTGQRLAHATIVGDASGTDLTRAVRTISDAVTPLPDGRTLMPDDTVQWCALGLALTSADLVGVMRGLLDITIAYAADRQQYGVPVGSFQAVQHLLAEAHTLMEGSQSVALYASWAVDNLPAAAAMRAGRVAKVYSARAARTVCETAIQVHGGIGNTWDCLAHVYLRRALLSTLWFGDDGEHLGKLDGLS